METSRAFPPSDDDYRVLGLVPRGGQSEAVVKATFRALARELHPDVTGGDKERFEELHSAYERVLGACGTPAHEENARWEPPSGESHPGGRNAETSAGGVTYGEPPRWEEDSPPRETAPFGPGATGLARRAVAVAGRALFLSFSWPTTELAVFIGLVLAAGAGYLIHVSMKGSPAGVFLELLPGFLVLGRAIAVRERLDRRAAR